jgi:hypothetical protein
MLVYQRGRAVGGVDVVLFAFSLGLCERGGGGLRAMPVVRFRIRD